MPAQCAKCQLIRGNKGPRKRVMRKVFVSQGVVEASASSCCAFAWHWQSAHRNPAANAVGFDAVASKLPIANPQLLEVTQTVLNEMEQLKVTPLVELSPSKAVELSDFVDFQIDILADAVQDWNMNLRS